MDAVISALNLVNLGVNCICKTPQIYTLYSTKSTSGVSLQSVIMEFMAYTIYLSYNIYFGYPLMTFIEYPFIYLQDLIIIFMVLHYRAQMSPTVTVAFGSLYFLIMYTIMSLPFLMNYAVTFCTILSSYSKISQLQELLRIRNSVAVSLTTWWFALFSCAVRIFTTLFGSQDVLILMHFIILLSLNVCLVYAIAKFKPRKDVEKQQ